MATKGIAYLHIIEGATSGKPVPAFDYVALKRLFGGAVIANNNFDWTRANAAIAEGRADMIGFGKPFISNPDLVIRLFLGARLAVANRETFYGGGEEEEQPRRRRVVTSVLDHIVDRRDGERPWPSDVFVESH